MSGTSGLSASAGNPLLRGFKQLLAAVDRISYGAIIATMGLMTTLVAAQVFARYVLSTSIDSADELSRLFFVWSIFLAIPHGIKSGIHVGIDVLVLRFSPAWRRLAFRLTTLCSIVMMIVLCWVGVGAVEDKWQELMPTIELTAAVFYIAVLICAGHSLLHLFAQLLRDDV